MVVLWVYLNNHSYTICPGASFGAERCPWAAGIGVNFSGC
jgi:hypothetical protein